SHATDARLTYDAGEIPAIRVSPHDEEREMLLQHPGFRQTRITIPSQESEITFEDVVELGHYDLRTTGDRPTVQSGFSINPRASESDLARIDAEELDEILGEKRYQVARSIGELQESINIADLGRELFPI